MEPSSPSVTEGARPEREVPSIFTMSPVTAEYKKPHRRKGNRPVHNASHIHMMRPRPIEHAAREAQRLYDVAAYNVREGVMPDITEVDFFLTAGDVLGRGNKVPSTSIPKVPGTHHAFKRRKEAPRPRPTKKSGRR